MGGNSRTTMIINCSPSSYNEDETLSTLRFGMRAKTIKNKATVNEEKSTAELKALLRQAESEIARLRSALSSVSTELQTYRSGGSFFFYFHFFFNFILIINCF